MALVLMALMGAEAERNVHFPVLLEAKPVVVPPKHVGVRESQVQNKANRASGARSLPPPTQGDPTWRRDGVARPQGMLNDGRMFVGGADLPNVPEFPRRLGEGAPVLAKARMRRCTI